MKRILLCLLAITSCTFGEEIDSKNIVATASVEESEALERFVRNMKSIKSALDMFALDFDGHYPSDKIAKVLDKEMKDAGKWQGDESSSEGFLRQLKNAHTLGGSQTHFHYYPLTGAGEGKPLTECFIEAEECNLSFVKNLRQNSNTDTPVLLAPMIPNTLRFDPKALGGKAVVICVGNAVKVFDIDSEGNLLGEGKDLFVHGKSVWENQPVTPARIQYPETKK